MATQRPLNEIMRSEFAVSRRWHCAAYLARWAIAGVAIYAIGAKETDEPVVVYAAFLGPLVVLLLRELGAHFYQKGERVRRLFFLEEGLGREPSEDELLDILENAAKPQRSARTPIGEYYSSALPPGPHRVLHQLQESAFWTAAQARRAMLVQYVVSGVGTAATIILAFFWLRERPEAGDASADYANLFANLLLFFIAGATLAAARANHALRDAAMRVRGRATELRKREQLDEVEVFGLVGTYDNALAAGPALPAYTYKLWQKPLQEAWDAVQARDAGRSD